MTRQAQCCPSLMLPAGDTAHHTEQNASLTNCLSATLCLLKCAETTAAHTTMMITCGGGPVQVLLQHNVNPPLECVRGISTPELN